MAGSDLTFLRRLLLTAAVVAGGFLAWRLREVFLLLFGAILVAQVLRSLAEPIARRTRLGDGLSLAVAAVALVAVLALAGAFFGWRIQSQVTEATDLLPQAFAAFLRQVRSDPLGARVLADVNQAHLGAAMPALLHLPGYALSAAVALADLALVTAGGFYLAAQPDLYREGLLRLAPARLRGRLREALGAGRRRLRQWLAAQAIAMAVVGVLVGLGAWLIGIPAPAALGLFAGAAEFVPILGPVAAAAPALLLALVHGPDKAAWTLLMFVVVQRLEGDLLLPLLQQRLASLPPVMALFALIVSGVVFGPLGVLLATPLTIVGVALFDTLVLDPRDPAPPTV